MSLSRRDALRDRRREEKSSSSEQGGDPWDRLDSLDLVAGGEGRTAGDVLSVARAIVVLLLFFTVALVAWRVLAFLGY